MKKFLYTILICLSLLFIPNVYAISVDTTYDYCERTQQNNFGVNKKWEMNVNRNNKAQQTPCVDTSQKIYDYAKIIDDDSEYKLKSMIDDYIKETKSDLVIITVDDYYYRDEEHEDFVADFYDYNDFGIDFDHYSGTVIIRNNSLSNRYYNIYTFGDAQLYYSGSRTERVLDAIYDDISNDRYLDGFSSMITMLKDYHKKGIPFNHRHDSLDEWGYYKRGFYPPILIALIISIVVSVIYVSIQKGKHKTIKKETKADNYLDLSTINYKRRENNFVNSITTSVAVSSSSGGSSGGGHSRGSSGGGHSSGGGRHG